MTLTQLEYIVAVNDYKSFSLAADKCFVTQPTLSMQINKLEEELGVKIFDRSKQPVIATDLGKEIIDQARIVLSESKKISELIKNQSLTLSGILRLGVIPTLAPYFLPNFLNIFLERYPQVDLFVEEMPTEEMIINLKKGKIDCGLLATPLSDYSLTEMPMFYEPFVGYLSRKSPLFNLKELAASDLNTEETWILNEGHCLRNQVLNICQERKHTSGKSFHYESGSLETLKRLVELDKGITILPFLATLGLDENQQELVRYFKAPAPVREISLVIHRQYLKKKLVGAVAEVVLVSVPEELKDSKNRFVVPLSN